MSDVERRSRYLRPGERSNDVSRYLHDRQTRSDKQLICLNDAVATLRGLRQANEKRFPKLPMNDPSGLRVVERPAGCYLGFPEKNDPRPRTLVNLHRFHVPSMCHRLAVTSRDSPIQH